mmetsp:Transcript_83634/g.159618  ORF Transcript_83634/g.159618 Transcript_83634/m.159618 type:complete len:81 (+) Transcript_83634:838-1080(+)
MQRSWLRYLKRRSRLINVAVCDCFLQIVPHGCTQRRIDCPVIFCTFGDLPEMYILDRVASSADKKYFNNSCVQKAVDNVA